MKRLLIASTIAICSIATFAQTSAGLTPFVAGTTTKASDMNAQLQYLANAIDALVPVGTVISSFVAPSGEYLPGSALWAFADGTCPYAAYTAAGGLFPDMRGQFIRGVNMTRADGYQDPDAASRTTLTPIDANKAGSIQKDALQGHAHDWTHQWGGNNGPSGTIGTSTSSSGVDNASIEDATHPMTIVTDRAHGSPRVAAETRPSNVAVYWYIKVK